MTDGLILVIDLGTQSIRGTAVDRRGNIVFTTSRPVATDREGPRCEQDPAAWERSLNSILEEAGALKCLGGRIQGMVATGTLSGLVCLDSEGRVLRPAIMYGDQRSRPQAERIRAMDVFQDANTRSGWRVHSGDFLPQLLWVAEQEPEVYARSTTVLDCTGYLNLLLTGKRTMDEFTRFNCYSSPRAAELPVELFAALDLDTGRLGMLREAGARIGALRSEVARRTGLPECPVFTCSYDSICGYLGAGLSAEGDALDISGTVTSFGVLHGEQVIDPASRVFSLPWASAESWLVRGSTAMSGGVLEWARREVVGGDFSRFNEMVEASGPGAGGVVFLPFLAGERAPLWNENATGTFLGITPNTSRADMARAVYEGLCYSLRHIQMVIETRGVRIGAVRVAGGLARNSVLNRLKADVTGKTLQVLENAELTTLGCVAVAGASLGWYRDLAEGQRALVKVRHEVVANPGAQRHYAAGFARYLSAVEVLDPLFRLDPAWQQ